MGKIYIMVFVEQPDKRLQQCTKEFTHIIKMLYLSQAIRSVKVYAKGALEKEIFYREFLSQNLKIGILYTLLSLSFLGYAQRVTKCLVKKLCLNSTFPFISILAGIGSI